MKHIVAVFALFIATHVAWSQEETRRALTSTGLTYSIGDNGRACGLMAESLTLHVGKRFKPNFQAGIGAMPGVCVDEYILFDDRDYIDNHKEEYENGSDAFFVMPAYAWLKYDFIKRMVSPYIMGHIGAQVSSYSPANGSFYWSAVGGVRIAFQKIALCPYLGFSYDNSKYEHVKGNWFSIGANIEF